MMSQLFISSKKRNFGSVIKIKGRYYNNSNDVCFQEIEQMAPILLKANVGNQLLITLNVPDTWCDRAGDGGWFAIKVNDTIATRGVYYSAMDGQRVPIVLQTVVDIHSEQNVVVKAMWCNENGTQNRNCNIGEYSETVLTVLLLD